MNKIHKKIKNIISVGKRSLGRRFRNPRIDFNMPKKLHLGCGTIHIDGFLNVDLLNHNAIDIYDDVRILRKFPNDYAELIYACHVLEHFAHDEIIPILERWLEVLKPAGELRISVPDIDKIVLIYSENWEHFQTDGNTPWIGLLYGGQKDKYDFHKTGFNFCWLRHLLEKAGFVDIYIYPHEPHFIQGVEDASLASAPFGKYLSLNIVAKKSEN